MKKVLLVSTVSSVMHDPLRRALEEVGCEVQFVDFRMQAVQKIGHPVHRIMRQLPTGLRNHFMDCAHRKVDAHILKEAQTFRPDLIFVSKAKNISIDTLDALRKVATTINWYPDAANNWTSIQRIAGHFDHFFVFDRSISDTLKRQGFEHVHHLPFCGDIDKSEKWPNRKDQQYPVAFLGSYHPQDYRDRLDMLLQIKDLGLQVWGNREWLRTPLADCFCGPVMPNIGAIKRIYADSRIVIHMDANAANPGASGLTMRPFDVASAGSMLIAQDDRAEIFELFRDGEEFVSFHGAGDIRQKVEYYLQHEDERRAIARAGFERVQREHTYVDRVRKIFAVIGPTEDILTKVRNLVV